MLDAKPAPVPAPVVARAPKSVAEQIVEASQAYARASETVETTKQTLVELRKRLEFVEGDLAESLAAQAEAFQQLCSLTESEPVYRPKKQKRKSRKANDTALLFPTEEEK